MAKKEYKNGDLTIVWEAKKCIHAAICVEKLPSVYKPDEKPWIKAENATPEELKAQIDLCPSGALSYYNNAEPKQAENSPMTKVSVIKNGPLRINGKIEITGIDGTVEIKEKITAFCRCNDSSNKPYCDGTHRKNGFTE